MDEVRGSNLGEVNFVQLKFLIQLNSCQLDAGLCRMMPFVESNYASEGMDVQKEPSCQRSCPRRDGEKINKYVHY